MLEMPRRNLATRPFYNERLVHVVLVLLALVAGTVLVLGGFRAWTLTTEHESLTASADGYERTASEIQTRTVALLSGSSPDDLELLAAAAHEANLLIDQRVFSWTQFLNLIEATLPPDVMLTSLRPEVDVDRIGVSIGVIGRHVPAIDQFVGRLEATGAFVDVLPREEEMTADGTYRAILFGRYLHPDASAGAERDGTGPGSAR